MSNNLNDEAMKRIAGDGAQQAEPVAWVDEKAGALVFGGWDKQPFAKSYKPVFYATPSASAQQAIYQCMCTDDDNGREDVWMDVTSLSFEQLSKRHDVRSRIVYAAPAPASPESAVGSLGQVHHVTPIDLTQPTPSASPEKP